MQYWSPPTRAGTVQLRAHPRGLGDVCRLRPSATYGSLPAPVHLSVSDALWTGGQVGLILADAQSTIAIRAAPQPFAVPTLLHPLVPTLAGRHRLTHASCPLTETSFLFDACGGEPSRTLPVPTRPGGHPDRATVKPAKHRIAAPKAGLRVAQPVGILGARDPLRSKFSGPQRRIRSASFPYRSRPGYVAGLRFATSGQTERIVGSLRAARRPRAAWAFVPVHLSAL